MEQLQEILLETEEMIQTNRDKVISRGSNRGSKVSGGYKGGVMYKRGWMCKVRKKSSIYSETMDGNKNITIYEAS